MARKRRAAPVPGLPEPIVVDVRGLTNFAFNAGLTIDLAQDILLDAEMEDCRIATGVCPNDCSKDDRILIALRAFDDRDVAYCEGCGLADVGL